MMKKDSTIQALDNATDVIEHSDKFMLDYEATLKVLYSLKAFIEDHGDRDKDGHWCPDPSCCCLDDFIA